MNKKPNLTDVFVDQVKTVFEVVMRFSKGIEFDNITVRITEKPKWWLVSMFFSFNGQEYNYSFFRKPSFRLIDPEYFSSIADKILDKLQISKNKERAEILQKTYTE